METKVIKLSFSSPVHFGDGRLSGGKPTCDAAALFSALFIEALHMGRANSLLDAARSGELILSDAFPYIGEELFVPKPMTSFRMADEIDPAFVRRGDSRVKKAFKKLEYIRLNSLNAFLHGTMDPLEELGFYDIGAASLRTRVNLERFGAGKTPPYGVGLFSFRQNAGIYFVVRGSYDIVPFMDQLQYSGLGGKRTSGYGRFSFEVQSGDLFQRLQAVGDINQVVDGPKLMLLSSAIPREDELEDGLLACGRYRIIRKSGFVQSPSHAPTPQKKRDLFAFAPGSLFSRMFDGEVIDVNLIEGAHPVYRYAKAMWMKVG